MRNLCSFSFHGYQVFTIVNITPVSMYGDSTGRAPIHVNRITIIVTNIENI